MFKDWELNRSDCDFLKGTTYKIISERLYSDSLYMWEPQNPSQSSDSISSLDVCEQQAQEVLSFYYMDNLN